MLTLVNTPPVAEAPPPSSPLFDMDDLMEMAEADLYLRMPTGINNLPRQLNGKIMHARRLVKLAQWATGLLIVQQDLLNDADNFDTMARQPGRGAAQRFSLETKAGIERREALVLRTTATAIYHAIGQAEILDSTP